MSNKPPTGRDLRSFEIRFESAVPIRFDSENFRIGRVCPLLVVVRRLKPLTALSGTVYRLASSMSGHTPVLFNVFEPLRIGMRNLYFGTSSKRGEKSQNVAHAMCIT